MSNIRRHPMLQGLTPNKNDDEEDTRYTEYELPESLGERPSNRTLRHFFSNYGWVYLNQVTNNSDYTVHYENPYWGSSGDIKPGRSECYNSKGYIPLYSSSKKYEINYYNTTFKKEMKIYIKDLDGDWLISLWQDEVDEDIRSVRPPFIIPEASIELTINNTGYSIYNVKCGADQGGITWESSRK